MNTIKVPAKLYDEALDFVNARRKDHGLEPITELPAGEPGNSNSCPCASACGTDRYGRTVSVGMTTWHYKVVASSLNDAISERGPGPAPSGFIHFFDRAPARWGPTLPIRDA